MSLHFWQTKKTSIFYGVRTTPYPMAGRKPQTTGARSRVGCHNCHNCPTHLNPKTTAFSFIFCHSAAKCFPALPMKFWKDLSKVGDVDVVPPAFTTMANKRKTFYSKVEGINQLEKGNLKQRGTWLRHTEGTQRGENDKSWVWGVSKNETWYYVIGSCDWRTS